MTTFEEILKEMSIEDSGTRNFDLPRISSEKKIDLAIEPENIEQLNAVLESLNLQTINENDSTIERLEKIDSYGLVDAKMAIEMYQKIEKCKQIDKYCDSKEVEIANCNIMSLSRYEEKSLNDLRNDLEELKDAVNMQSSLSTLELNKSNIVPSLWYLEQETEGAYLKERALSMLERVDEPWSNVLKKIVKEKVCKVEEIGEELGIDRVSLLKIIYNFCSKDIIDYDRLNDSVSILGS